MHDALHVDEGEQDALETLNARVGPIFPSRIHRAGVLQSHRTPADSEASERSLIMSRHSVMMQSWIGDCPSENHARQKATQK